MDIDKMVEAVTAEIMRRMNQNCHPKVAVFGSIPPDLIGEEYELKAANSCADTEGCDFILMTAESFRAVHGGGGTASVVPAQAVASATVAANGAKTLDLAGKHLIHERDLREAGVQCGDVVKVAKKAIVTALAFDYAKSTGVKIIKGE